MRLSSKVCRTEGPAGTTSRSISPDSVVPSATGSGNERHTSLYAEIWPEQSGAVASVVCRPPRWPLSSTGRRRSTTSNQNLTGCSPPYIATRTFTATKGKFTSKEEGETAFCHHSRETVHRDRCVERRTGTEAPPHLYDLTSLQVDCNRKFGYSADITLKIIQTSL